MHGCQCVRKGKEASISVPFKNLYMHLTFCERRCAQSVYLKQVRSLAKIFFPEIFLDPDVTAMLGSKAALIQLMAQVGILFTCYISSG